MTESHLPYMLAYCRGGFEPDCRAELQKHIETKSPSEKSQNEHVSQYTQRQDEETAAFVFQPASGFSKPRELIANCHWSEMIFARQLLFGIGDVLTLPSDDRVAPIAKAARKLLESLNIPVFGTLLVESPDTNDGKALGRFCESLSRPLRKALDQDGLLGRPVTGVWTPKLHVFLPDSDHAYVTVSDPQDSSPWSSGVPRLKLHNDAPSRATLKLEEALRVLLTKDEQETALQAGQQAVDLGAAPGGWTFFLLHKGLHVTAVDNAQLATVLAQHDFVEHIETDAFKYRPRPGLTWVFCDVVEQPIRIASLMATWIEQRWAQRALFNLKLPMKQRFAEVEACLALFAPFAKKRGLVVRAKHLYHDRSEVTVYVGPIAEQM